MGNRVTAPVPVRPGARAGPSSRARTLGGVWKAVALITVAVFSLSGVSAAALLATTEPPVPEDPTTFHAPAGCPELPEVDDDAESLTEVIPADEVHTAGKHLGAHLPLVLTQVEAIRAMLADFAPTERFESRLLGTVEVVSDGPVAVDPDQFDALVELTIGVWDRYGDERLADLHACYEERVVSGELADTGLRLFVPADPSSCFQGYALGAVVDGGCDATGFTIPELALEAGRLNPFQATLPATVAVAPGADVDPERQAALILVHEIVHHLDNEFGLVPRPGEFQLYEQRAHYVERIVEQLPDHDVPSPITYLAGAVEASVEGGTRAGDRHGSLDGAGHRDGAPPVGHGTGSP
jgi:hypothetical protein